MIGFLVVAAFFAILAGIESAWRWCNRDCDRVLGREER